MRSEMHIRLLCSSFIVCTKQSVFRRLLDLFDMENKKSHSIHQLLVSKRTAKKNQLRQARFNRWSKLVRSETSDGIPGSDRSVTTVTPTESATARKFRHRDEESGVQDVNSTIPKSQGNSKSNPVSAFRLCDISLLSNLVSNISCSVCQKAELEITESEVNLGLASELLLQCRNCQSELGKTLTSRRNGKKLNSQFEVSQRTVTAMVDMGVGFAGLQKFCTVMGLKPLHHSTFNKYVETMTKAVEEVADETLEAASKTVKKVYSQMSPDSPDVIDVAVSYDGSWMTRGHTSNFGVGVVIDIITGLILDYQVLSKYCHICAVSGRKEIESQAHNCDKNFDGSSGAMEVAAAMMIWKRSIEKHGLRYTTVLSDGDSKAFNELSKAQIYGPDHPIEKEECINHVSKRMGTALRKVISECRKNGTTLGGKGRGKLTQDTVGKLTTYYQRAIRNNLGDITAMRNAVYATLFHAVSTDDDPHHNFCPSGLESWCFFNRAKALGEKPENHNQMVGTPLTREVGEQLLPIYRRLTNEDLLKRCMRGKTQNSNESLHSIIWSKCPKTSFLHRSRVETGVRLAVSHFNQGRSSLVKTLEHMGLFPNAETLTAVRHTDEQRLKNSARSHDDKVKQARKKVKFEKLKSETRNEKKEGGPSYSPGAF